MFGWFNSFKSDISLIAVLGIPSSSDSNRIFFSACVVGKFPLLYLSLEEETEKHSRLIKERDRLRKKIEKLKKLNK